MERKNVLVFGFGLIVGAIIGALGMREYTIKTMIEVEKEILEELDSDTCKRQNERLIKKYSPSEIVELQNNKTLDYNRFRPAAFSKREDDCEMSIKAPHVITFEQFNEEKGDHDKLSLCYYTEGNTLVLEDGEEEVTDIEDLVGDALNHFGYGSDDPDVVYVRNEKISIDYEILRQYGRFEAEPMEG